MGNLGAQLRDFLIAVRTDLVEKRLLLPVIVLAVAAVAVPIAFAVTKPAAQPIAPAPPAGPGAAIAAKPTPPEKTNSALGPLHNPFPKPVASAVVAGTTGPTGPVTARTPTTSQGTTGPSSTKTTPTPVRTPTPTPKPRPTPAQDLEVWSVDYSFGQGVNAKTYHNALRLQPLPSASSPVIQYLGITKAHHRAAFLIWGSATATGDGVCLNGQTPCQVVELRPGSTEFLDVAVPGSGTVQFELDVLAVRSHKAASLDAATKAHLLQSAPGVKLIKTSTATALAKLKYSVRLGLLVVNKAAAARAQPQPSP